MHDGRAYWTLPATVVADDPETLALWIAPGSEMLRPLPAPVSVEDLAAGRWQQSRTAWEGTGVLMLRRPSESRHAVWLFWADDAGRTFRGWYINLELWRRDGRGVDAFDHELDIWVGADGRWEWKDSERLDACVEAGIYTAKDAARFRREGETVLAEWPFPTGWENWRPDPTWGAPSLRTVDGRP